MGIDAPADRVLELLTDQRDVGLHLLDGLTDGVGNPERRRDRPTEGVAGIALEPRDLLPPRGADLVQLPGDLPDRAESFVIREHVPPPAGS